MQLYNCKTILN